MNGTSNGTFVMHDPYVQGAHDPWAAAPAAADTGTPAADTAGTAAGGGCRSCAAGGDMPQAGSTISGTVQDENTITMRHGLSEEVIGSPISAEEAYQGSLRGMLGREIGAYIAATFLMGSGELVRWEGRLYEVGNNYLVIYQQNQGRYVVGDINSLRFVEFSETGNPMNCQLHNYSNGPTAW